jgi:hypothetical protein
MERDTKNSLGLSGISFLVVAVLSTVQAKSENLPHIPPQYQVACVNGNSNEMGLLEKEGYRTGHALSCYEGVATIKRLPSVQDMVGQSDGLPSAYRNQ